MTTAINYARHDKLDRYVFLAQGQKPDPVWLHPDWAWWQLPSEFARRIGETHQDACERTQHGVRACGRCRAELAGRAIARGEAR